MGYRFIHRKVEVSAVKKNVAKLATTQESILHVLKENLAVLDATQTATVEIRETINAIITSLNQLSTDFSDYKERAYLRQ